MVDRIASRSDSDEELRAYLEDELDTAALEAFDAMRALWESGELPRMMGDGDFSELPASVRPR